MGVNVSIPSRLAVVAVALGGLAACSSDSSSSVAPVTNSVVSGASLPEPTDPSIAVDTLPVVTVTPPEVTNAPPAGTTKPKPSTTTTTTKPKPSTTTTTTTAPPVKDNWKPTNGASVPGPLAVPCCAENFHGTPSPELPAEGGQLADGTYFAEGQFRKVPSKPLKLKVFRLEACSKIPDRCEEFGDDATAMGIDRAGSFALTLPLDKSVRIVYTGYSQDGGATVIGTGADLAKLATALHDSYDKRIGSRIAKGQKPDKVLADVAANPGDGWAAADASAGVLTYTVGSAPPVLLQAVPDSGNGADLIGIVALHVEGGKITLITYGGFYS